MKITSLTILFFITLTIWLSTALVRVENERYAMMVGMCEDKALLKATQQTSWDYSCLANVETRTSWIWHIFHALKN